MGKRDTKQTLGAVKQDQAKTQDSYAAAQETNQANTDQQKSDTSAEKSNLTEGYNNLSSNPVSNRIDTSRFNPISAGYHDFSQTGGFSPERTSSIEGSIGGLKDLGKTGGIDDTSMNRFRGLGVYDEFAKNGGYTSGDKANILAKSLSPIGAFAQNQRNESNRRLSVQGGYAPGMDASNRQLSRDTSRNIADTSLNAGLGLMDRVNQGKQWGASGATSSEGSLQGLRTGNMLQGNTNAASLETNLQDTINKYKMMGLSGEESVARAVSGIEGQNVGFDFNNANNANSMEMNKLNGLGNIYGTDNSNMNASMDRGNNLLSSGTNANLSYYQPRTNLATQPGMGGNLIKGIGAAAGVGSAMMSGGASGLGNSFISDPGLRAGRIY